MTRRSTELLLLFIAAIIVMGAYTMLIVANGGVESLSLDNILTPIGLIVAFLIAHIAVRILAPAADPVILPIVLVLTGIGITFITDLAPELALRQVMWLFAGVAFMILTLVIVKNLSKVANFKYSLMIAGFVLLLSPLIPVLGQEIYGSRIWIGFGPFSFQPGELAKICIALFLAGYLAHNREMLSVFTHQVGMFKLPDFRTIVPLLIMWLISILIVIFEKDLGSALVFFAVFVTMLYVASGKKFYLVFSLILAIIAAVILYTFFGHVQDRVSI